MEKEQYEMDSPTYEKLKDKPIGVIIRYMEIIQPDENASIMKRLKFYLNPKTGERLYGINKAMTDKLREIDARVLREIQGLESKIEGGAE